MCLVVVVGECGVGLHRMHITMPLCLMVKIDVSFKQVPFVMCLAATHFPHGELKRAALV